MTASILPDHLIAATVHIVTAQLGGPAIAPGDLPGFIRDVHGALAGLGQQPAPPTAETPRKGRVPISRSVTPDYIVCLEDGKKLKMLKRHLAAAYGLTPDAYRKKWGLPADYPMIAPNYSMERRELALSIGLGRKKVPGQ